MLLLSLNMLDGFFYDGDVDDENAVSPRLCYAYRTSGFKDAPLSVRSKP